MMVFCIFLYNIIFVCVSIVFKYNIKYYFILIVFNVVFNFKYLNSFFNGGKLWYFIINYLFLNFLYKF